MNELTVDVMAVKVLGALRNAEKRMNYAAANAISSTMLDTQDAIRHRATKEFVVRKKPFIRQQVAKIDKADFPSGRDGRLRGRIHVGQVERLLLSQLEEGGVKKSAGGGRNVAVAVTGGPARRSFLRPVPSRLYIQNLDFTRTGFSRVLKGAQRTYLIPDVGVFKRTGTGRKSELAYTFSKSPRLRPRLRFVATARARAVAVFDRYMQAEIREVFARHMA